MPKPKPRKVKCPGCNREAKLLQIKDGMMKLSCPKCGEYWASVD